MPFINIIPSGTIYKVYSKNRFHHKSLQYLNTKAGSLSCALSWSTSFGKFSQMNEFPNEGNLSAPHSSSVEACFSWQTEFKD